MAIIESLPFSFVLGADQNHTERFLPHFDVRFPAGIQIIDAGEGVVITDFKWASFSYLSTFGSIDPHVIKDAPVRFLFGRPKFPKDLSISLGNLSRKATGISGHLLVADKFTEPQTYLLPLTFHHDPHPYPWKAKLKPGETITMQARPQLQGNVHELVIRQDQLVQITDGELQLRARAFAYLHPQLKKNIADPNSVRELDLEIQGTRIIVKNGDIAAGEVLYIEATNKTMRDIVPFSMLATQKVIREAA